jgi:hypothetical protein
MARCDASKTTPARRAILARRFCVAPGLVVFRAEDGAAAEDGVAVVEDGGLAGGDGALRRVEDDAGAASSGAPSLVAPEPVVFRAGDGAVVEDGGLAGGDGALRRVEDDAGAASNSGARLCVAPGLVVFRAEDGAAAEDGVAVVEDGGLAGGDGALRRVEDDAGAGLVERHHGGG